MLNYSVKRYSIILFRDMYSSQILCWFIICKIPTTVNKLHIVSKYLKKRRKPNVCRNLKTVLTLLPVFAFNAIVNAGTKAQGTDVILYFGGPHSMLSSQHTPCHFSLLPSICTRNYLGL